MNKVYLLFFVVITVHALSCSVPSEIVLYNHTENDIAVNTRTMSVPIEKDGTAKVSYDGLSPTFSIEAVNEVWQYTIVPVPIEYRRPKWGGLGGYDINFLIEPNGFIYILKPGFQVPAVGPGAQPQGFPLVPV